MLRRSPAPVGCGLKWKTIQRTIVGGGKKTLPGFYKATHLRVGRTRVLEEGRPLHHISRRTSCPETIPEALGALGKLEELHLSYN